MALLNCQGPMLEKLVFLQGCRKGDHGHGAEIRRKSAEE
jgi:hypothetical protein